MRGERAGPFGPAASPRKEDIVIVLGVILLIVGFLLSIHIIWILGIVALVIGAVLAIAGAVGHKVGGRAHWF
jgi:uncharacterized membrane protein HdeD (DUF308 family)